MQVKAGIGLYKMSWAFILEPIGEDAPYLTSRVRMESTPKWAGWLMATVIAPPVHSWMSGVRLTHIRSLAGRDAQQR
jgi:hypothetical protein